MHMHVPVHNTAHTCVQVTTVTIATRQAIVGGSTSVTVELAAWLVWCVMVDPVKSCNLEKCSPINMRKAVKCIGLKV